MPLNTWSQSKLGSPQPTDLCQGSRCSSGATPTSGECRGNGLCEAQKARPTHDAQITTHRLRSCPPKRHGRVTHTGQGSIRALNMGSADAAQMHA